MLKKLLKSNTNLNVLVTWLIFYGATVVIFAMFVGLFCGIAVNLAPILLLAIAQQNKTTEFFAALPVKRKHVVLSQVLTIVAVEAALLAVCALGMIPARFLYSPDELLTFAPLNLYCIGMYAATFGLVNLVILPIYFVGGRRGNVSNAFVFGGFSAIGAATFAALMTGGFARVGEVNVLLVFDAQWRWLRGVICAAGVALWAALTALSYAVALKVFQKNDL